MVQTHLSWFCNFWIWQSHFGLTIPFWPWQTHCGAWGCEGQNGITIRSIWSLTALLQLRTGLEVFSNLRPIIVFPQVSHIDISLFLEWLMECVQLCMFLDILWTLDVPQLVDLTYYHPRAYRRSVTISCRNKDLLLVSLYKGCVFLGWKWVFTMRILGVLRQMNKVMKLAYALRPTLQVSFCYFCKKNCWKEWYDVFFFNEGAAQYHSGCALGWSHCSCCIWFLFEIHLKLNFFLFLYILRRCYH